MILLTSTSDKIQVVTSGAVTTDVHASWLDNLSGSITPGSTETAITTATTTDVIAAPAASTQRNVKELSIRNKHAATAQTVTVQKVNASITAEIIKCTLSAGEELEYADGVGWRVLLASGAVKTGFDPNAVAITGGTITGITDLAIADGGTGASTATAALTNLFTGITGVIRADAGVISADTDVTDIVSQATNALAGKVEFATQAEMETATDTTRTASLDVQHFHPGHPKCWAKVTVSGGTPTLATSYNITSMTDTNIGQLTITIANDFSSANWACQVTVERAATALTVANLRYCGIRFGGQAAGTALLDCWDGTATTANAVDPAAWHMTGLGDL